MGSFRARPTTITLLLAALAFAGLLTEGHSHDPLAAAGAHSDLPAFSGGHAQPDRSTHVESATRLETGSCVACLLRQRERGTVALTSASELPEPEVHAARVEPDPYTAADLRRLPATRAPPRA